ncbi:MAG: hypothetical protein JXP34_23435 [Planctomycetes bacterium]|nr:hypothetical protein [Planctomycetota bacterium]
MRGLYGNSPSKNPGGGGEAFRTDAEGAFRLEHLIEGEPVRVTAAKDGYETARIEAVEPGSVDLTIVLRRAETGGD